MATGSNSSVVITAGAAGQNKFVDHDLARVGDRIGWTSLFYNPSDTNYGAGSFIDVLPYPGDGRGTTLLVRLTDIRVELSGTALTDMTVYVTDDDPTTIPNSVLDPANLPDGSVEWCVLDLTDGTAPCVTGEITALRYEIDSMEAGYRALVHVTADTDGNRDGDLAVNDLGEGNVVGQGLSVQRALPVSTLLWLADLNVVKTFTEASPPDPETGHLTASYQIDVVNNSSAPAQYGPLIDTPDFDANLTPVSATWVGPDTTEGHVTLPVTGPYTFEIGSADIEIAAKTTHTYLVTVTFEISGDGEIAECAGPGTGLYNSVALPPGQETGDPDDNDDCGPLPRAPISIEKYGTHCDVNVESCPLPGAMFAIFDTDPTVAGASPISDGITVDTQNPWRFTSVDLLFDKQYWLVETRAGTGHQLLAEPMAFTITAAGVELMEGTSGVAVLKDGDAFTIMVTDPRTGDFFCRCRAVPDRRYR